jgi:hypothetical protein
MEKISLFYFYFPFQINYGQNYFGKHLTFSEIFSRLNFFSEWDNGGITVVTKYWGKVLLERKFIQRF